MRIKVSAKLSLVLAVAYSILAYFGTVGCMFGLIIGVSLNAPIFAILSSIGAFVLMAIHSLIWKEFGGVKAVREALNKN